MNKRFFFSAVTALCLACQAAWAQASDNVEMADAMRSNGKIYVVVTVLSVIFCGLTIYLVRLDRRISRLEKQKASQV